MKLKEYYIQMRDIDWFMKINGTYIHAASAGGELPNFVDDYKTLRCAQKQVAKLPERYNNEDLVFNEQFIKDKLRDNIKRLREHGYDIVEYDEESRFNNYVATFAVMARKGFVSFDRTNIYDIADNRYHWVARPKQLNDIHDLNIPHILSVKTPISGRFAQILKMQQEWNLIDLINKSKRVAKLVR